MVLGSSPVAVTIYCKPIFALVRSSHRSWSIKKLFNTSQNLQENTWTPEACNFIEKQTLTQLFSCKFFVIFKEYCFYRILSGGCFWAVWKFMADFHFQWKNLFFKVKIVSQICKTVLSAKVSMSRCDAKMQIFKILKPNKCNV